jgi:hypothetical protein
MIVQAPSARRPPDRIEVEPRQSRVPSKGRALGSFLAGAGERAESELPKAPHRVAATRHCLFRIENLLENASGRMAASARFRMSRWLGNEWPLVASVFFATDDRQEEYQVTVATSLAAQHRSLHLRR